MKKIFKPIGIIAIIAVIGFSMTACEEEDDPSPKSPTSQWTTVTQSVFGSDDNINEIAYGNGKFVACNYSKGGDNTKIATSTDGVTWTAADVSNIFDIFDIRAIAYGNGKFVTGGCSYNESTYISTTKIATSTDGTTWTAIDVSGIFGGGSIRAIAYGNGKFVAGGWNGKMATSTDGVTWTAVDVSSIFGTSGYIGKIAYGNGKFVACGNSHNESTAISTIKIATSTDGTTWTAVTQSVFVGSGYGHYISAIAYGNGKFVACAYDDLSDNTKIATSMDGVIWTAVTQSSALGSDDYISAIAYGNGKFVACGWNGKMATSTDGVTWTAVDVSGIFGGGSIRAIAYGNDKFVAGGYSGKMAYMLDN